MKNIESYKDIEIIINNQLDVYDSFDCLIPFVNFINMPIMHINHMVTGIVKWSYEPQIEIQTKKIETYEKE